MALAKVRTIWSGAVVGGGITSSYFEATPLDVTSAQTAIDLMRDFWTTLGPNISTGTSWNVLGVVQQIDLPSGLVTAEIGVIGRAGSGTAAGDRLPPATQGLVKFSTGTFAAGRRIQGHWNIPSPVEAANDVAGAPTSSYFNLINTAANTLAAAVNPTLVVYSRRNALAPSVASGSGAGKWAVLRSRRD